MCLTNSKTEKKNKKLLAWSTCPSRFLASFVSPSVDVSAGFKPAPDGW